MTITYAIVDRDDRVVYVVEDGRDAGDRAFAREMDVRAADVYGGRWVYVPLGCEVEDILEIDDGGEATVDVEATDAD